MNGWTSNPYLPKGWLCHKTQDNNIRFVIMQPIWSLENLWHNQLSMKQISYVGHCMFFNLPIALSIFPDFTHLRGCGWGLTRQQLNTWCRTQITARFHIFPFPFIFNVRFSGWRQPAVPLPGWKRELSSEAEPPSNIGGACPQIEVGQNWARLWPRGRLDRKIWRNGGQWRGSGWIWTSEAGGTAGKKIRDEAKSPSHSVLGGEGVPQGYSPLPPFWQ